MPATPSRRFARDLLKAQLPAPLVDDLTFLAEYKYDHYEMYEPGVRFLERLHEWLAQFADPAQRLAAAQFLRDRLVFISQREMQDLARFLYFNQIVPILLDFILERECLDSFQRATAFRNHFAAYLRRCLFIALSDGAKIDYFRRHHVELSQEQVVPYYRASSANYVDELRKQQGPQATFSHVILIDDFCGSGYTLAHRRSNEPTLVDGSLQRVHEQHASVIDQADKVLVCHYIGTASARRSVMSLLRRLPHYATKTDWITALELDDDQNLLLRNHDSLATAIIRLCDQFHRPEFDDSNSLKGGGIRYGFGKQALPVVLYSNTPNNSVFVLWFEKSPAPDSPGFTPIFRRVNRHRLQ